jgi:hypothetical protein
MAPACGGNPVGDWTIVSSCLALHGMQATGSGVCAGETIDAQGTYTGTMSLLANAGYNLALNVSVTEAIWFPAACVSSEGATTCDQLTQLITSQVIGSGITSTQCAPSPKGGCDCTAAGEMPVSEAGTFATSGFTLTFTPNPDNSGTPPSPSTFTYCASVTQMDLVPPPNNTDTFTASGDIKLVRQ